LGGGGIATIDIALDKVNIPFESWLVKRLGIGDDTSFWNEDWCSSGCLVALFPRLAALDHNVNY